MLSAHEFFNGVMQEVKGTLIDAMLARLTDALPSRWQAVVVDRGPSGYEMWCPYHSTVADAATGFAPPTALTGDRDYAQRRVDSHNAKWHAPAPVKDGFEQELDRVERIVRTGELPDPTEREVLIDAMRAAVGGWVQTGQVEKMADAVIAAGFKRDPQGAADAAILAQLRRYLERYEGGRGGTVGQLAVVEAVTNIINGGQVAWAPSDSPNRGQE